MKKLPVIALSLAAAATLAACGGGGTYVVQTVPTAPTKTVILGEAEQAYPSTTVTYSHVPGAYVFTAPPLRPGFGRIESMYQVVWANGKPTGYQRFSMRMDDGSVQVFDSNGPTIAAGARVEITTNLSIRYPIS